MHRARVGVPLMAALLGLLAVCPAHAQTNLQLWGNVTVDWVKSDRLVYELDFEPKVLVDAPDGAPSWRNLDVTPNAEYSPKGWLDLSAEVGAGYTKQTDDVNSIEVTPRVGARFHLFSRDQLRLEVRGDLHLDAIAKHHRGRIRDRRQQHRHPPETSLLKVSANMRGESAIYGVDIDVPRPSGYRDGIDFTASLSLAMASTGQRLEWTSKTS